MKHRDPTCKRRLDDDSPFVAGNKYRKFYFCCSDCKEQFEQLHQLYTGKAIDQDQRKAYKSR